MNSSPSTTGLNFYVCQHFVYNCEDVSTRIHKTFFFRYSWFYTQIHDVEPSVVIHMEAACFVTYLKEVLSVFLSICTGRLKFMTISSVCKRYASPRNLHIVYLHDALSKSKAREQQSNVRPRRCKNKPVSKTQNKLKLWKVINPFGLA